MYRFPADCHRLAIAVFVLASAAIGCRDRGPSPQDAHVRSYVRLAVALGERDPDSLDYYVGPDDTVADVRRTPPSLAELRTEAAQLSSTIAADTSPDPERSRDLVANLKAIDVRAGLLMGRSLPYDEESLAFFGLAPQPIDQEHMATLRARIAAIVGSNGRLADRYSEFAARVVVPPAKLPVVMQAAVDECRRHTVSHVALPPGEGVALEFVHDKPWSAFSRYLGAGRSRLQVNSDFRFTVDQALEVACHETYPGHHTRSILRANSAEPAHQERLVQLMFSPDGLVSEASAMLAAQVAFSSAERERVERERLFPLAGLQVDVVAQHIAVERLATELQMVQADVARRYLDGRLEFVRAVQRLEDEALVPHAEATVKYINQYRSYVTTYTTGPVAFAARLAACTGSDPDENLRWRCFEREMLRSRI
ncbi:MAG TPA: hypothetical protein VGH34_04105 [Vicinamibacterales bacterium]